MTTLKFLSFCAFHNITISGSRFRHFDIHWELWKFNDGWMKKEVDRILVWNQSLGRSHQICRGADDPTNTNRRLLVAKMAIVPPDLHGRVCL